MNEQQWADCVISWSIAENITIDKVFQITEQCLYAVRYGQLVLNKKGMWEYEPSPSNRTEAFFRRCRYASKEEAYTAYQNRKEKP